MRKRPTHDSPGDRDGLLPAGGPQWAPLRGSRVLLAGLEWGRDEQHQIWSIEDSLAELSRLAETAGARPVDVLVQHRDAPDPATFFGKGKVEEIASRRREGEFDLLLCDDDLTPSQQRTLEKRVGVRVLDRSEVILEIFAQRAHTREARLQVELAQLEYQLPRLRRAWSHLERQEGATAGRGGPGETQLALDRLAVRHRIAQVKRELEQVRAHRARGRAARREGPPVVALVGYTNAGKSTLMNRLTQAGVFTEDQLFATLDPTTRRLPLPGGGAALISDTVGFIQKLPHQLVAAFRATLEELNEADLLLHVIDAAHPNAAAQRKTVEMVLGELNLADKPTLLVLNKADLLPAWPRLPEPEGADGLLGAVAVSALTGEGIDELLQVIARALALRSVEVEVALPYQAGHLAALFRREGYLISERYGTRGVILHGHLPRRLIPTFRQAGAVRMVAPGLRPVGAPGRDPSEPSLSQPGH